MSTPLKQHKKTEKILQEQLYGNIDLLTYVYPTTKEFNAVFKKKMFEKNNKAAFQQVVYYLLNILNPRIIKEKITTWPLYDVKLEPKFRNEVLAYISELNNIYEDADIPNIMASHLISPGGFNFIKFMFKLSQLVLREHLKKNEKFKSEMLYPIKPHSNNAITDITLESVAQRTALIESDTKQIHENFMKQYETASQEASNIIFEQSQINNELGEHTKSIEMLKKSVAENNQYIQKSTLDDIKSKIIPLNQCVDLCKKCSEMLIYLKEKDVVLECDKKKFILPKYIKHFRSDDNATINLLDVFNTFISIVEKENLEMPLFTTDEIESVSKSVETLLEKYSKLNEKQQMNKEKFLEVLKIFQQFKEPNIETEK